MKKLALIGLTMLTAFSLAACSPSSNSESKNSSEKGTTETSNKPTLEIPESVVADSSKTAEITGKTTPNTKVQIGYGIIGDKETSDKDGNFTLKYEIDESKDQDTIEVTAKNNGDKTTKKITIKQNPEVIKKKEADAKAKTDAEAKAKASKSAQEKATEGLTGNSLAQTKTAISYLYSGHMSKQGLYDQLTSEYGSQMTADEANNAINRIDPLVNWNNLATLSAKSYRESGNLTGQALIDQLTSEYGSRFTPEQAQYGVAHIDDDVKSSDIWN